MLNTIAEFLRLKADDLETGNTNIDANGMHKVLNALDLLENGDLEFSKLEAADYLGVSRATLDNYVKDNFLCKGHTHLGTKALFWYKSELNNYLEKYG